MDGANENVYRQGGRGLFRVSEPMIRSRFRQLFRLPDRTCEWTISFKASEVIVVYVRRNSISPECIVEVMAQIQMLVVQPAPTELAVRFVLLPISFCLVSAVERGMGLFCAQVFCPRGNFFYLVMDDFHRLGP
jgi:hypothetical protein